MADRQLPDLVHMERRLSYLENRERLRISVARDHAQALINLLNQVDHNPVLIRAREHAHVILSTLGPALSLEEEGDTEHNSGSRQQDEEQREG